MTWEYRVENCRGNVADTRWLNDLGEQGWELVAILNHVEKDDFVGTRSITCAYLKRAKKRKQDGLVEAEEPQVTRFGMREL